MLMIILSQVASSRAGNALARWSLLYLLSYFYLRWSLWLYEFAQYDFIQCNAKRCSALARWSLLFQFAQYEIFGISINMNWILYNVKYKKNVYRLTCLLSYEYYNMKYIKSCILIIPVNTMKIQYKIHYICIMYCLWLWGVSYINKVTQKEGFLHRSGVGGPIFL